ncbi:RNA polymerase sigma factor [Oceanobacter mangrovi]|uniref:RNA polymerase sigma factor n=1 Tax=Oceanobacter mangrovi TaxID=2862510 RepID=UPI001C8DAEBD|nr:sigma-70 family RNA polymerase sigma factor [Oceanobacter mangrovi]
MASDNLSMKSLTSLFTVLRQQENSLLYFLASRVGCPHTAADLLQQLTEKLLRKPDNSEIEDEKAYLYQAARNEVISHFRSEQSRLKNEHEYGELKQDEDGYDVEAAALASFKLQQLNQRLQQLPPLTREVFWRYRIDGQRQKQIAEQLDISLSSVEKHLATATRCLRQSLRDSEQGNPANHSESAGR